MGSFDWDEFKNFIKSFILASFIFCGISIVMFIGVDALRGINRLEAIDLIYFLVAGFLFSFAIVLNRFIEYIKQIYAERKKKKNEEI